jgi:hypothetical protein
MIKKISSYISENILFILTLFFLAFIPLYPKLPILDLKHTWVYIRIEDFLIAFTWIIFLIQLLRKKATLRTPLTVPIVVFWLIGALATLHGILFLFPSLEGLFPQIAVLHFLRRVEYLSLFFLAFSAMRQKNYLTPVVITITTTLILVILYGIGQRVFGFPAFLTMNEEFAKGIPLRLSPQGRIPSTFAGHYDLAAYLLLMIPIMGSLVFGFKRLWQKGIFFLAGTGGLILLMMTQSRVSFAVYLVSISFLLLLLKKKLFIIPVLVLSIVLAQSFDGLSSRLASTFTQVDLAVDSRTGKPIGIVSEGGQGTGQIVIEDMQSNGENLPQGSKYINIPSTSGTKFTSEIIYKKLKPGSQEQQVISKNGEIIVKKAFAYDVSFTTRFQGQWPRALEALQRNFLLGSGYSSINLATDNNYLRILGETGVAGLLAFLAIFTVFGIYIKNIASTITETRTRTFIYGVTSGVLGLGLNAILIDVFEASKVAFTVWPLMGITLALLLMHQKKPITIRSELRSLLLSVPALLIYLATLGMLVFAVGFNNYFVGDDFTWLRWAADCSQTAAATCQSALVTIQNFFVDSKDFFFRPGTKIYFYVMYPLFELFPLPFHVVSVLLHITAGGLIFFIARKLLHSSLWGFVTAALFLILSTHHEAVFWISVTGTLIAAVLNLFGLLLSLYWRENKNIFLFVLTWLSIFVATLFHEFGAVGVLLIILTDMILSEKGRTQQLKSHWIWSTLLLLIIPLYYFLRQNAQSVWFQGDYSYNLVKLPFNVIGNVFGYVGLGVAGPISLPMYSTLRAMSVDNLIVIGLVGVATLVTMYILLRKTVLSFFNKSGGLLLLGVIFFIIPLLPFLGLGNIAARYNYLAAFGVVFGMVVLLQVVYTRMEKYSKYTAVAAVGLAIILFSSFHIRELQRLSGDWNRAGEITNNTLVGINFAYRQPGVSSEDMTFYFVNTPIRYGEAWIFPVGLSDALWFSFQTQNLKVLQSESIEDVLPVARNNDRSHVFTFLENGDIVEVDQATASAELNEQ